MRRRMTFSIISLLTGHGYAYACGGGGVGITSPPCGFGQDPPSICVSPPPDDCEGNHPDYEQADLGFNARINTDLDILYSRSFHEFAIRDPGHPGWPVTPIELEDLAIQIDGDPNGNNPLGLDYQNKWDLQLVFDYYTYGNQLYGQFGPNSNFRFDNQLPTLPGCADEGERNHVDVYLVPKFEFERHRPMHRVDFQWRIRLLCNACRNSPCHVLGR